MSVSLSVRGRRKHRHPDGRAKSTTAIKHDRCFGIVAGILECLVKASLSATRSRFKVEPKIVYTNDFSWEHFDETFIWDEPIGVHNDDYCVLRDEEWEGPEPPFFVACDDEVRVPFFFS